MLRYFRNRKLRKLKDNARVLLNSTNVFFEDFEFFLKYYLAKQDAHNYNNVDENKRILLLHQNLTEIAKLALIDSLVQSGKFLK